MRAYPKIFALGTDYIKDIFNEEVEITEKVDGSQFGFGKISGRLYMRSKGRQLFPESVDKMFSKGVSYIQSIQDALPPEIMFYAEYLSTPRHNVLKYDRTPIHSLALFGGMFSDESLMPYNALYSWAQALHVDIVPCLYRGKVNSVESLLSYLDRESFLGGPKIEGIVVKNYHRKFLLGGQPLPLMAGKLVSEKFKETHRQSWNKEHTSKGKWEEFLESFRTEARWAKAVQHLRDNGNLLNDPKDIGLLIKEIGKDIQEEEQDYIKNWLWHHFSKEIIRKATAGFPEWYKQQLLGRAFDEPDEGNG